MRAWPEHDRDEVGASEDRLPHAPRRPARPPRLALALATALRGRRGDAGRGAAAHAGVGAGEGLPAGARDHDEGVEETEPPHIGFVGAGRAGLGLALAFQHAGWPVTAVASRDPGRRDRFVASVIGALAFAEPAAVLDSADLVFLTVPDDAVARVAASLHLYSGQALVHVSGLLPASVLAPALAAGTEAGSFHPLVAFSEPEAVPALLHGATVALEGDANLLPVLADLARAVGAQPVAVESAAKAAYSAAAVLATEGLMGLLDAIVRLGRAAGLDEAGTLAIFDPLLRQGIDDAQRLGLPAAWTGPSLRGDEDTVRAHLGTLHDIAPTATELYAAAARIAIGRARDQGELSTEKAEALLALLAGPR